MADFFSDFSNNYPYLCIVLLTLVPALELRASIPYGILMAHENWLVVVALAVVSNILLGPVVFFICSSLAPELFQNDKLIVFIAFLCMGFELVWIFYGLGVLINKGLHGLTDSP